MALIAKQLQEVWDALRANNRQRSNSLEEVRIRNLRGIGDLRVPFGYPVCVLAGPNGCGKSTVLFACACAYRLPDQRNPKEFVPSSLFPNFISSQKTELNDSQAQTDLEFHYLYRGERLSMRWHRGKAWNRSYMGRKNGEQPVRTLYLRTLANLTNPSEVRGHLQIGRKDFSEERITDDLLIFAHRVLPRRYRNLSQIKASNRDLLFAELEGEAEARYSEFHMSAGERAILRISRDISDLKDSLVLIDEVEAGLHPYTQQQAMLEFQRIALRQNLQIVVASHSPVVLESVPPEARLFLSREEDTGEVTLLPPHRDIMQKALYGQSRDQLSILCEDDVAEGLITGFLDVLNVDMGLRHDDFVIGRDTGQSEFPGHVRTLAKFGKLADFLLVLDGDARSHENEIKMTARLYGQVVQPLFLPGDGPPESWIWSILESQSSDFAGQLGISVSDLESRMRDIGQMVGGAVRKYAQDKTALEALSIELNYSAPELARIVGRSQANQTHGQASAFLIQLKEQIAAWRQT